MKLTYSHDKAGKHVISSGPTSTNRIVDLAAYFWLYRGVAVAIQKKDQLLAGRLTQTPNKRWLHVER